MKLDWMTAEKCGRYYEAIKLITPLLNKNPSMLYWHRGIIYLKANLPGLSESDFEYILYSSLMQTNLLNLMLSYTSLLLGDNKNALIYLDSVDNDVCYQINGYVVNKDFISGISKARNFYV